MEDYTEMTVHARQVLDDCKAALRELTYDIAGSEWRLKWVACIALLRAVGHVLDKVDGSKSCKMKSIIEQEWVLWKTDEIFKSFIEEERNNILKEYNFGAGQGVNIQLASIIIVENMPIIETPTTSSYTYQMNSGYYKGEDPREIVKKVIEWWEEQLDKIDKQIIQSGSNELN